MTATLVLTDKLTREITQAAKYTFETAGVLLASFVRAPNGDVRLLGRQLHWVPDDAYLARERDHLSIASHGYVHALAEAERLNSIPLWFHTHPTENGIPRPSDADRKVDHAIADLFRMSQTIPRG
jgi:proteasome lid subunit RPN8/RPN11